MDNDVVCFAILLPIFKDVMESATFRHDRLEILSIEPSQ